jgi:hypothetical protein
MRHCCTKPWPRVGVVNFADVRVYAACRWVWANVSALRIVWRRNRKEREEVVGAAAFVSTFCVAV